MKRAQKFVVSLAAAMWAFAFVTLLIEPMAGVTFGLMSMLFSLLFALVFDMMGDY